ncbi:MAG: hypothetical protein JO345_00270 [Streptosporangiaceae bacterium]|nr:hypothetical protein [Streptosporangiaceae bacterium]
MSARDTAESLAAWAETYVPTGDDLEVAHRALLDTVAVTVAARDHPVAGLTQGMPEPLRWGAIGHVLDFDDLHMRSTTQVSVVCVPAVLAAGGDERAYLALLDEHTGFASFTDEAVCRPEAQSLLRRVDTELTPGGGGQPGGAGEPSSGELLDGGGLLDGELEAEVITQTGQKIHAALKHPPGSPARPPTPAQFAAKLEDCLHGSGVDWRSLTWHNAADIVRAQLSTTMEARRARTT